MTDDKDAEDGSDWLSSQFDATGRVPAQPPPVTPPPVTPPPVTPPPVTPAPSSNSDGGFSWGLKAGGTVDLPPAATPAVAPAAPPAVTPPALASPPPEPYLALPTQPYVSEPTKPLSWDDFASTQQQGAPAPIPPVPLEQPTEVYTVQPWQPAAATSPLVPGQHPEDAADPTSAIDSLFGDNQFQDFEEVGVLTAIQVPPTAAVNDSPELREPREPLSKSQKVLLGVAAGLLGALILVGLYFFGEHIGSAAAVAPTSASTGASSATPTPAGAGGPAAPGIQKWTALQGGECIQPFSSAWALTFTVVPCTVDHDAEMVFKGKLPEGSDATYPTAAGFQKEITPLCSAPTAINYGAAASVTDLQVSFSYPPNTASWLAGDRNYYCFVDRVSGGNLPGDLAVAKAQ